MKKTMIALGLTLAAAATASTTFAQNMVRMANGSNEVIKVNQTTDPFSPSAIKSFPFSTMDSPAQLLSNFTGSSTIFHFYDNSGSELTSNETGNPGISLSALEDMNGHTLNKTYLTYYLVVSVLKTSTGNYAFYASRIPRI